MDDTKQQPGDVLVWMDGSIIDNHRWWVDVLHGVALALDPLPRPTSTTFCRDDLIAAMRDWKTLADDQSNGLLQIVPHNGVYTKMRAHDKETAHGSTTIVKTDRKELTKSE